jgi:hypothetical protein
MTKAETAFIWTLSVVAILLTAMIICRVAMVYGTPDGNVAGVPVPTAAVR